MVARSTGCLRHSGCGEPAARKQLRVHFALDQAKLGVYARGHRLKRASRSGMLPPLKAPWLELVEHSSTSLADELSANDSQPAVTASGEDGATPSSARMLQGPELSGTQQGSPSCTVKPPPRLQKQLSVIY